jgi:multisubunit Na+/H+ antiporter MnhE subunit
VLIVDALLHAPGGERNGRAPADLCHMLGGVEAPRSVVTPASFGAQESRAKAGRERSAAVMTGALRAGLVWWVLCAALWLALVDTVALPELATGAVVAAGAAVAALLVRARRQLVTRVRWIWALRAGRACLRLVADLPLLVVVLWRRGVLRRDERGAIVSTPLQATDPDDPVQAGDRVAAAVVGSLTPASVVVEVDREGGAILEHRLAP